VEEGEEVEVEEDEVKIGVDEFEAGEKSEIAAEVPSFILIFLRGEANWLRSDSRSDVFSQFSSEPSRWVISFSFEGGAVFDVKSWLNSPKNPIVCCWKFWKSFFLKKVLHVFFWVIVQEEHFLMLILYFGIVNQHFLW